MVSLLTDQDRSEMSRRYSLDRLRPRSSRALDQCPREWSWTSERTSEKTAEDAVGSSSSAAAAVIRIGVGDDHTASVFELAGRGGGGEATSPTRLGCDVEGDDDENDDEDEDEDDDGDADAAYNDIDEYNDSEAKEVDTPTLPPLLERRLLVELCVNAPPPSSEW